MSEPPDTVTQQIAALEAALQQPLPEELRRQLLTRLQSLQAIAAPAGDIVLGDKIVDPQGIVKVGDGARINGVVVGINLGRIVYARDPDEDERVRLVWYLARLANRLARLPLRGLASQLDDGQGMVLPKIYVMIAINGLAEIASASPHPVQHYFQDSSPSNQLKHEYSPDWTLPSVAVASVTSALPRKETAAGVLLLRLSLATEAVYEHPHIVFLGASGAGKSTFLRHLAWALAQRGLDQLSSNTALFGWDDEIRLLPILLSLRTLAERIATAGANMAVVSATLRDEITREYDVREADALLDKALAGGKALLLFDGLDEVPPVATPGVIADRLTTLQVVRTFAELHAGVRVVLTCRTWAFDDTLRTALGWPIEPIAPFTLGQIRHFIAGWFATLVERKLITHDLGEAQQAILIDAIIRDERLRTMAENPLLLTMMAIILVERGELHRDRPLLYERILKQLLDQREQQQGGPSRIGILGIPNLRSDDLRPILDELSYKAHGGANVQHSRGRLSSKDLRYALAEFLEKKQVAGAWEAAGRCLAYFTEHSGLLIPEDDGAMYAFAHLSLQEHCAGRHILLAQNAVELVMQHRSEEHWHAPIALGLGVVQNHDPPLADRIDRILTELIDPDEHGVPKPLTRWYHDVILAAKLGAERDWSSLRALINVDRHQRDLRRGLVALLHDITQPLPIAERVRAGFLLGDLGDPRFPVTIDQWQDAIISAYTGKISGYFCPIPPPVGDLALWIARYPITNAQLREWMRLAQISPWRRATDAHFNRPNQPAAGVNWYVASEFCTWLSQQIGVTIRLPSEAEWHAAAGGSQGRRYPWGDNRLRDRAATKEDHDLRAWPYTVPIGCYPAGASAVGALDMVGNTWEWTSDVWQSEMRSAHSQADQQKRVLRGGGYLSKKKQMLVTTRIGLAPGVEFDNGFRVVLETQAESSSD